MKALTQTNQKALSTAILLLRIMSGLILFVAGAGKLMGWFGGMGIDVTLQMFEANMHLSSFWIYLSCYTEFIGGALVILGCATRIAAGALVINMMAATWLTGFKMFFMGGAAYPFLLGIIFAAIVLTGPMQFSVDAMLKAKNRERNSKMNLAL